MKPNVKVHEVNEAPAIGKIAMMGGIRSKEAAEKWAAANFYTEVWFWKSRERVYAQKHSAQPVTAVQQVQ
jgi:hypothetical protein